MIYRVQLSAVACTGWKHYLLQQQERETVYCQKWQYHIFVNI